MGTLHPGLRAQVLQVDPDRWGTAARRHPLHHTGGWVAAKGFDHHITRFARRVKVTHGHAAGDAVLTGLSGILREVFRPSDHLIRWGGEEFLVVARFVDRKSAPDLAERLREAIESRDFLLPDGTGRIGLALFDLAEDPGEQNDLAAARPEVVARLQEFAGTARSALGDTATKVRGTELRNLPAEDAAGRKQR